MSNQQHEITEKGALLNDKGELIEPGYSKHLLFEFDKSKIAKSFLRLKMWDYYLITDGHIGVALTIADNGYMGMDSVSILNFDKCEERTQSIISLFPKKNKILMPTASYKEEKTQDIGKNYQMTFSVEKDEQGKLMRHLFVKINKWKKRDKDNPGVLTIDLVCSDEPEDNMVIVTPFKEDKKAFYYNQKIVGMKVTGFIKYKEETYTFDKSNTYALLDWGRGIWTYDNLWNWGAASGNIDGHEFGFNIGYGFGDTSQATENMLFYDGKAHKLTDVVFNVPQKLDVPNMKHLSDKYDFLKPWTFASKDKRFEMNFTPILDRTACMDFNFICSDQHQVFGYYSGKVILDDGTVVNIDKLFGFAEKVHNKW